MEMPDVPAQSWTHFPAPLPVPTPRLLFSKLRVGTSGISIFKKFIYFHWKLITILWWVQDWAVKPKFGSTLFLAWLHWWVSKRCSGVLTGRVGPRRRQALPPEHSLPPRMLMIKLPLMMVQPRSSWADVTESMVFSPSRRWHTLGQGPRQGVHIKLHKGWRERSGHAHTHVHTHTHTPESVLHRVPSDHKAERFNHSTADIEAGEFSIVGGCPAHEGC